MEPTEDSRTPTLGEIISADKALALRFRDYLHERYNSENFAFWLEVEIFKQLQDHEIAPIADIMMKKYFSPDSTYQLNVDAATQRDLEAKVQNPSRDMWNSVQKDIWKVMESEILPEFLKSPQYLQGEKHYKEPRPKSILAKLMNKGRSPTLTMMDQFYSSKHK